MTVNDDRRASPISASPARSAYQSDRVKIRKRFLGWANFVFDTQSPFFGQVSRRSASSLITTGPRIKPGKSNLALAFDNIWNNSEWQHGDVWTKLMQTIVMAFIGTLLGALVSLSASHLLRPATSRRTASLNQITQALLRFLALGRHADLGAVLHPRLRSGPLAGIAAIFLTETGTLGKVYSETLKTSTTSRAKVSNQSVPRHVHVQRYGVVPQVLPVFASQTLYHWESNTRSATIIGAVGAGGIGLKLWEAMRTNTNWDNVAYMVVLDPAGGLHFRQHIQRVALTPDGKAAALRQVVFKGLS